MRNPPLPQLSVPVVTFKRLPLSRLSFIFNTQFQRVAYRFKKRLQLNLMHLKSLLARFCVELEFDKIGSGQVLAV